MTASPPPDDLLARLGRALAPAYEMECEIGRGGMAVVYRARDVRLKRAVAIKLLPPELAFRADIRSRFMREAETAARLSHPNIVPIYAVDERDGLVYFVMALVVGESVGDRIRRAGAMSVDETRRILREVADALAFAHQLGVVHRDIKPDNILIDRSSGRALVTDFGIARAASEEGGGSRLTATGAAIGTPAYMSPEQCVGEREIDGRSDLYSLGAVAYEMLAGRPPFTGANTPSMMMKQVTEVPMPLRERRADVPPDLERIIMRLLAKDPASRFPDGAALVRALDGAPFTSVDSDDGTDRSDPPRGEFAAQVQAARDRIVADRDRLRASTDRPSLDRLSADRTSIDRASADHVLLDRGSRRDARRDARELRRGTPKADKPLAVRLRSARNRLVSYLGSSAMFFGINAFTGHAFWWCVFPIMGMGIGFSKEIGSLWADGVPLRTILGGDIPPALAARMGVGPTPPAIAAPPDGPHTATVRQAVSDRRNIDELLGRMSVAERARLPDVAETAQGLLDRITALAGALDRLDASFDVTRASALDVRIAEIEAQPADAGDRERRLGLLRRQRDMLADLVRSRANLLEQLESAALLLQNLALDLLTVRSSGLDSAMSGITSATQEARALSREIGYVLSAADELRQLDGESARGL